MSVWLLFVFSSLVASRSSVHYEGNSENIKVCFALHKMKLCSRLIPGIPSTDISGSGAQEKKKFNYIFDKSQD